MRLTVIIPLIGVILVFNESTAKSLALAPDFLMDLGLGTDNSFSFDTLYFTYFGLCALGFGSIVFSLACPSEIQTHQNQLEFVSSTPIGQSKNLAKSYLRYVVQAFAKAAEPQIAEKYPYPESLSYPNSLVSEMHGLLEELYQAADFDHSTDISSEEANSEVTENSEIKADQSHEDMPDFMNVMNGAGYFDFSNFGIAMANEVRVNWAYTIPFYDEAPNFPRDIAYIKYRTDDFSKFSARFLVMLFYTIGFSLLSIPTAQTFYFLSKTILISSLS